MPDERSPSNWATYNDGRYGFSFDYPSDWEPSDRAGSNYRGHRVGGFWVSGYNLSEGITLEEFATQRRDSLEERYRTIEVFDTLIFTQKEENGREFYRLIYRRAENLEYCIAQYIAEIYLSYAFPAKPYGYVVTGSICEHSLNEFRPERENVLDSFREWNFYLNETHGFSISAPQGWSLDEITDDSIYVGHDHNYGDVNVIAIEQLDEDTTLAEFAEGRRQRVREGAEENEFQLFEVTAFEETTHRSRDAYRLSYRRQTAPQYCVSDHQVIYLVAETEAGERWGLGVVGDVCEHKLEELGPVRDAIMDSFRP